MLGSSGDLRANVFKIHEIIYLNALGIREHVESQMSSSG